LSVPPRFSYWTILIDGQPTAFRAAKQEELLPTLTQLRRTNPVVEMRWFSRGKLWDSPEQARWATQNRPKVKEKRPRDWRPGGTHQDPRARFEKRAKDRKHRWTGKPRRRPDRADPEAAAPTPPRDLARTSKPSRSQGPWPDRRRAGRGPRGGGGARGGGGPKRG
jgi:hypothetical protein